SLQRPADHRHLPSFPTRRSSDLGEINLLLFNGLTGHDGDNAVVPALAKSWDFDEETCTYTFHLEEDVRWHDGEPFTAEDVQFTIDRKSTRLNSSHVSISYAVFCL